MSKIKKETSSMDQSSFLQNFIYLMNNPQVRESIIKDFCKTCKDKIIYLGTFYVSGAKYNLVDNSFKTPFDKKLVKKMKQCQKKANNQNIHFTVSYTYDEVSVHFVTFVYEFSKKKMIHFDPGIGMYDHGQKTIVPSVLAIFQNSNLLDENNELGICHKFMWKGKKTGVQFNNLYHLSCPRDAFCQSWTIFFIYQSTKSKTFSFVKKWCNIAPEKREAFLILNFIIPVLKYFPQYRLKVEENLPSHNYLKLLKMNFHM